MQSDARLLELGVAAYVECPGLSAEGQLLQRTERRGGIPQEDDADTRESAATVSEHDEVGEGIDVLDAHFVVAVGIGLGDDDVAAGRGWIGSGDVDEVEVGAIAIVGDEEPVLTADDGVLDVVFDAVSSGPDLLRFGFKVVGADAPVSGRRLRSGDDEHHPARTRETRSDEEALIGFVEDAHVVAAVGADDVAPHLLGSPGVVDGGVEDEASARVEGGSGEGAVDRVGEVVSRGEVANAEGIAFVAGGVDAVEETAAVV